MQFIYNLFLFLFFLFSKNTNRISHLNSNDQSHYKIVILQSILTTLLNFISHKFLIHSSMPTQPETPIIQADMPYPSIPNFHIIPSNDSLNPYSIKIIDNPISNEVDDPIAAESKPSNSMGQFTAIHYAIGESGSPVQPSATFERSNNMLDAFDGNTNDSDSGDFDKLLILRGSDVPYSLENPFMIKSEPFGNEDVQYDDAVIQIDDNDAQNGDPATQNGDVVIKNDDVVIQNDDFVIKNDDVVIQNDDFVIQNDDIVTYSDDWITLIGEPNEFFWWTIVNLVFFALHGIFSCMLLWI